LRSAITVSNPAVPIVPGTGEASGIGGDVRINASTVTVQNGAAISAVTQGSGKGGTVEVRADTVHVTDAGSGRGARIATDTFASGSAGNILIDAQDLLVNHSEVSSNSSGGGSSGATGNLTLKASDAITLSNGGTLSIRNDAKVTNPVLLSPTLLSVSAPRIVLSDSTITAESTGNVDASDIRMRFVSRMIVDPSSITTSANEGNGGDIDIQGPGLLWLDHSQVTTSVLGLSGNGGDIRIGADALLMQTGFIQANTAAPEALGGNVAINVGSLLSFGPLLVGGENPLRFAPSLAAVNVMQAAAPQGVSGDIELLTPVFDVATKLSPLRTEIAEPAPLARDLCRLGAGSSLTPLGRGGLRPTAVGPIRPDRIGTRTPPSSSAQPPHPRYAALGALACARFQNY
jgi:hypothetical protein